MYLFMYELGRSFDSSKPVFEIKKIEVEEKPKTYKVVEWEYVHPKKERGFNYINPRINKTDINALVKTGYYSYTYKMFVFEDTNESRKLFLDKVLKSVGSSIDHIRENLNNMESYYDNIVASDFCSLGR